MFRYKNKYSTNRLIYKRMFYKIEKCTSKLIWNILISNLSVKPISEMFWKRKFIDTCSTGIGFGKMYH